MLSLLRIVLALAAVAVSLPAFAHAVLVEASPGDGQTLQGSPPLIVLRFNEAVQPVSVRLLDRAGQVRNTADALHALGPELSLHLTRPLEQGAYVLTYRVISADSHPVTGSIVFGIGEAAISHAQPEAEHDAWRWPYVVVRLLFYATLLPVAGGVMFLAFIDVPLGARAIIRRGLSRVAAFAAVAGVLNLAFKGAQLTTSTLVDPSAWVFAASVSFGTSIVLALIGLAAIAIGLRNWPRRHGRWVGCMGAALAAASFAFTGHGATLTPHWLAVLLVSGHLLPVAFWIGSLWPLIMVLHRAPEAGHVVVAQFSRLAVTAVALLLACGVALAAAELGSPRALAVTDYGHSLLFKILFVVAMLGLAAANKWRLLPRLGERDLAPRRWLVRSIRAEGAAALVIFSITAVLSTTSPPRSVAAAHGPGAIVQAQARGRDAVIELSPAITGHNALTVHLMQRGAPFEPIEAVLELSLPNAGIEPIRRPLAASGDGHYHWDGIVPVAGRWQARVEVLITDFDRADFVAEIPVK